MHKVNIISMKESNGTPRLRFEIHLDEYDKPTCRKLRLMGYSYLLKGTFIKELRNPDEMKDRYLFNIEFLTRTFGKDNISYFTYAALNTAG